MLIEEIILILYKLFQKTEERTLFNFFSKVSIALISKSKKHTARIENSIESNIPKNIIEGDERR